MTVREHLLFSAKLRMGKEFTHEQRLEKVEDVIIEMGLSACANTMIGTPNGLKGLSGGEKKRNHFEVLTSPSIIFCDEPTSGLDSFMSLQVVNAMKCLAKLGMTVITTIHQPPSQVFTLFDDLCLMACGRMVYQGPADKALNHWRECGFSCPHFYNPADYIISTLAVAEGKRAECISRIAKIGGEFEKSEYGRMLNANATLASTILTINGILFNAVRDVNFMFQFPCVPVLFDSLLTFFVRAIKEVPK
uniref:ABC transporter family G domain-containing protein n=1 Tax=Parascaris equorum TaxID=6256 RepID=A0A914RYI4_PAREQ